MVKPNRSCLHCALARALRAEQPALSRAGLTVTLGRSEAVWLPASGMTLYRGLRRLLQEAKALSDPGAIRLAVLDLSGKSHVEVTAAVPRGRGSRVVGCSFPRFDPRMLGWGFAEVAEPR